MAARRALSTTVEVVALHVSPVHAYEGRPADGPRPDPEPASRDRVVVRAGLGLVGDRYFNRPAHRRAAVTFFAAESLDHVAEALGLAAAPGPRLGRRNVVLRGVGVGKRLIGALELESGINDAPVYIAVVLLAAPDPVTWAAPALMAYELVAGALIGIALGWLGGVGLRRAALPATGLYPLATVAVCLLAYTAGDLAHASGFLAVYIAALVLGNARLPHRADTLSFAEGLGWIAQIGLFVLLGLYASPGRLLDALVPALVAGAVLVLLARPLSVLCAALPFRVPWREQVFISWSGLRGAVPIVFALIPLIQGVEGAQRLVDAVFVLVVVLTLVQGTSLPWLAKWLGLVRSGEAREVQVDSSALDALGAELLQVRIQRGSKLHGVYLSELRLPPGSSVSLVVRAENSFTPQPTTRLQEHDQLLVVCTEVARTATEQRIRAVDRAGRFARWKGDAGLP
ncbi:potassium/proton antiporter [Saccharothrix sp. MB29]|nr:potassium/proton antiporter [Saccharothrix sp. MB29]